jgi:glycosyltransferase involved in cell wall biosynthesis
MQHPIITTVIPTYRRPQLLRRAIQSVLDQSYPYLQVCVYDNASNDATAGVVKALAAHDERVHYYCHPENIGSVSNFIFGVSRVKTPLFNVLSDDDFLLPGFLSEAATILEIRPDVGFYFGSILSADSQGEATGVWDFGAEGNALCSPPRLFDLLVPNTRTWTSIVFRRSAVDKIGGLKQNANHGGDTDLILRCSAQLTAFLSNTPSAVFTHHAGSISVSRFADTFRASLNMALVDNVIEAIDQAAAEGIVTVRDAETMKAALGKVTERNLIRGALGVIARNELQMARQASALLATRFKRPGIGALIRAASLDDGLGMLLRAAIKATRGARQIGFRHYRRQRHSPMTQVVNTRRAQLGDFSAAS